MLFSEFATLVVRQSNAIDFIHANPLTGVVDVIFSNGYSYEYSNVSRRAIIHLITNKNISLGFWVNKNCIENERVVTRHRYQYTLGY